MIRVLRYPRLFAQITALTVAAALARDGCVSAGYFGWARVLLIVTILLLIFDFLLMSSRFIVDYHGVGVGFLTNVRRVPWEDVASLGVLSCNSRRLYLYGMYRGQTDFLHLLHRAPGCGPWGFVVPVSGKLLQGVQECCPFEINFSVMPRHKRAKRLRRQWQQTAVYALTMAPASAVAFMTGAMMLLYASQEMEITTVFGFTLCAMALIGAGAWLLYRAVSMAITCPAFNEQGVCAGWGTYLPWDAVRFGYVHRIGQMSSMYMLSVPLEEAGRRGAAPVCCLSMPDTRRMLLAYLTYCPHASKGQEI